MSDVSDTGPQLKNIPPIYRRIPPALRPLLSTLAAIAVLAALLAVFFWPLTVNHRVLSPADLIYGDHPWVSRLPEDYDGVSNPFQSDDAYLYYPRRHSFYEESGHSWWQDEYLSGARNTFSADFIGLDAYPVSLVYRVLPFPVANGFFHAGVLLVAGASMYLMLRQLRMLPVAAMYGGILYMLNGHFVVWLGAFVLPAMLGLIPLMIFGFERHFETRKPAYLLIPALCFAVQLYLAYIPGWIVTGTILTIYGGTRLAPLLIRLEWLPLAKRTAAFGAAAFLSLLVGAYSLWPSVDSALSSNYQRDRALGLSHLPLEDAWTFIFPDYWGEQDSWIGFAGNYPEWVAYGAISAVPLSLLGFWHLRRHWLGWFSLALLAFSASQVFGIPPLKELAHLPGLKQVAAGRWFIGMNLALALTAPAGLTFSLNEDWSPRRRVALIGAIATGLVLAVTAVLIFYLDRHESINWGRMTEGQGLISAPADMVSGYSTHFHRQMVLLAAGALLAAMIIAHPGRGRLAQRAIVAVSFLDLLAFGYDYNATIERDELYPETPGIAALRVDAGVYRVAPVASDGRRQVLPGYTSNLYGLQTITGYDHYRDDDYLTFIDPLRSQTDRDITRLYGYVPVGANRESLEPNLLRLLNVKYVVTSPSGLYEVVGGQPVNETAFPVYGEHIQGQVLSQENSNADAVEFLFATGGGSGPDSPINIEIKATRTSPEVIASMMLNGSAVEDNSWYVVPIPEDYEGPLFAEIAVPEATQERPLLLWGVNQGPEGLTRYDSGDRVPGSLTFRLLDDTEDWTNVSYQGDDLVIYEVEGTMPRAWGVGGIELLSAQAVFERIAEDSFEPGRFVVFAEGEGPVGAVSGVSRGTFDVEMLDYEPDSMTVRTRFSEDGFLVISNRFDGGWEATVDRRDADVLRANGILQAVSVEAGTHTVQLSFRPPEYVWGQRISVGTLIALLLTLGGYAAHHGWRRTHPGYTSS